MNSFPRSRSHALLGSLLAGVLAVMTCGAAAAEHEPQTHEHAARDTLTVVEMNHGDVLRYQLRNGQQRTFTLNQTSARLIESPRGGIVYSFDCQLEADGQPLQLRRYVCSQETFYEPWVINGVRLWLSSSKSVFDLVPIRYPEVHHALDADAILVVQDATLPICPQPMQPWFPIKEHFIDVGTCYNGDDPWLGPYLGQACHVGLDINMPKGTPLYAPIDFDDHWIFSADHRWRGVRRWPNGDVWGLQSHHVDKLLLDENTKIQAGTHYAEAAGKGIGSHQHSHFEFRLGHEVLNRGRLGGVEIDPWILFWQIFETDKARKGYLQARIQPLAPARSGEPVRFAADISGGELRDRGRRYYWTFGDGGWSHQAAPRHTFIRPGVYPVTLVVDDSRQRVTHTQHISVNGPSIAKPSFVLESSDNVTFRRRPVPVADVYGWPVKFVPHSLRLTASPEGEQIKPQHVSLRNTGAGVLPGVEPPHIEYLVGEENWVQISREGRGNQQRLVVAAKSQSLPLGRHVAVVTVECPGTINPRQGFRVELTVRPAPKPKAVVVDDRDDGFYATPYFWVGHQFSRCQERGHANRYLTNGGRSSDGEFVRFTPDLAEGRYEILIHGKAPLSTDSRFPVRIRHAGGDETFHFPLDDTRSQALGSYSFAAGTTGFVEFHARDSQGAVIADAVRFRPQHK